MRRLLSFSALACLLASCNSNVAPSATSGSNTDATSETSANLDAFTNSSVTQQYLNKAQDSNCAGLASELQSALNAVEQAVQQDPNNLASVFQNLMPNFMAIAEELQGCVQDLPGNANMPNLPNPCGNKPMDPNGKDPNARGGGHGGMLGNPNELGGMPKDPNNLGLPGMPCGGNHPGQDPNKAGNPNAANNPNIKGNAVVDPGVCYSVLVHGQDFSNCP